jgi:hypothetical protein
VKRRLKREPLVVVALIFSALTIRPSSAAGEGWRRIALQPSSQDAQVVSAINVTPTSGNPYWLLGGATAAAPPERKPSVWVSNDLQTFAPVAMQPNQGYGEIAEIFGIAAKGPQAEGLAAIGQAFGGAHGNPRTASWDGNVDGLREVRTNFELYNGPRQIAVRSIASNNNSYVIVGSRVSQNGRLGAASWHSTDGAEFTLFDNDEALSSAPNEQVQGLDVTTHFDGSFVAAGERLWWDPANSAETIDTDAIMWRSIDGKAWQRWTPQGFTLGGPGEQRIQKLSFNKSSLIAAGTETKNGVLRVVVWGPNGTKRVITAFGTSTDPLSTVTSLAQVGSTWFVAARINGVLKLASSVDTRTWTKVDLPKSLPSGGRARLVVVPASGSQLFVGASGLTGGGLWARVLTAG